MDDVRYLWLRDELNAGLDIKEPNVFEEFINRDEGDNEMKIAKFMNQTEEDDDFALIFHKDTREEEIEVQVELCKCPLSLVSVWYPSLQLGCLNTAEEEYLAVLGKETIDDVKIDDEDQVVNGNRVIPLQIVLFELNPCK